MVFFVYHRSKEFSFGNDYSPGAFAKGMMLAYQVPLYKKASVELRFFVDTDVKNIIAEI
jgi:hypothetical protein